MCKTHLKLQPFPPWVKLQGFLLTNSLRCCKPFLPCVLHYNVIIQSGAKTSTDTLKTKFRLYFSIPQGFLLTPSLGYCKPQLPSVLYSCVFSHASRQQLVPDGSTAGEYISTTLERLTLCELNCPEEMFCGLDHSVTLIGCICSKSNSKF